MAVGGPLFGALLEPLRFYPAAELAQNVAILIASVALSASVVAMVLRWRRSRNRERQQIKLLVYTLAVTAAAGIPPLERTR